MSSGLEFAKSPFLAGVNGDLKYPQITAGIALLQRCNN
jgi:hypothetical protein